MYEHARELDYLYLDRNLFSLVVKREDLLDPRFRSRACFGGANGETLRVGYSSVDGFSELLVILWVLDDVSVLSDVTERVAPCDRDLQLGLLCRRCRDVDVVEEYLVYSVDMSVATHPNQAIIDIMVRIHVGYVQSPGPSIWVCGADLTLRELDFDAPFRAFHAQRRYCRESCDLLGIDDLIRFYADKSAHIVCNV